MANTKQIMEMDYRVPENQKAIQRVLRQIKPLSKFPEGSDIPLSAIEKAIQVMDKKYEIGISDLVPDTHSNSNGTIWRATLVEHNNPFERLDAVHGLSIYEVLAKAAIRIYAEVRKRK